MLNAERAAMPPGSRPRGLWVGLGSAVGSAAASHATALGVLSARLERVASSVVEVGTAHAVGKRVLVSGRAAMQCAASAELSVGHELDHTLRALGWVEALGSF